MKPTTHQPVPTPAALSLAPEDPPPMLERIFLAAVTGILATTMDEEECFNGNHAYRLEGRLAELPEVTLTAYQKWLEVAAAVRLEDKLQ